MPPPRQEIYESWLGPFQKFQFQRNCATEASNVNLAEIGRLSVLVIDYRRFTALYDRLSRQISIGL
jgi:hypothetical protein